MIIHNRSNRTKNVIVKKDNKEIVYFVRPHTDFTLDSSYELVSKLGKNEITYDNKNTSLSNNTNSKNELKNEPNNVFIKNDNEKK